MKTREDILDIIHAYSDYYLSLIYLQPNQEKRTIKSAQYIATLEILREAEEITEQQYLILSAIKQMQDAEQ